MTTIVPRQNRIDVFPNEGGGVTVKMFDHDDGDQVVWFHPDHAESIVEAIRQAVREIEAEE